MNADIFPGKSYPLGATVYDNGVNFCLFSKNCESIELLFFDDVDDRRPARSIRLDPEKNKTFYYWHIFVKGIVPGQLYGYRAHGPFAPEKGDRFDGQKVLIDPYTKLVMAGKNYDRDAAIGRGDNCAQSLKSIVVDYSTYDWEGDMPLNRPYAGSVIYELHVGGFTSNLNAGSIAKERRGTYAGLTDKIPYLKDLNVTAVELMPVHQFDEYDAPPQQKNYWGYSPIAFFAPHRAYSSRTDRLGPLDEFRDMVKAFHQADIEVILDVVFNHTNEGDERGPTMSFRGLENSAYYILEENQTYYSNYSGCGNAINANHSIVRRLIMDCLRYWVAEMHVDGFRFDLASVMSRDESGRPLEDPPILWSIESDPVLAGTKIIAEAWDAAGLYQVGSFIGDRFAEWNGQYRDDVRRFIKGDSGMIDKMAARIMGSPDLYPDPTRNPNRSINFISCHDGFTLNDLVSYNEKHNEDNNENNCDGAKDNYSWNCGIEGATDDEMIEALRQQQIKNFLTVMLISKGTPMLLMGDETRRTQQGNNNSYCQDNDLSWFDWSTLKKNEDLLHFVKGLIDFTQGLHILQEKRFWNVSTGNNGHAPNITWHGTRLNQPDWHEDSHCLAFSLHHPEKDEHLHVIINAFWKPLGFELPALPTGSDWLRIVDTAQPSPNDFSNPDKAIRIDKNIYHVEPRSTVVLVPN